MQKYKFFCNYPNFIRYYIRTYHTLKMELHNLTTGYLTSHRRVIIQSDINIELKRGEFTCLLGPNGAGKTTLLRTLAGFISPLDGHITVDGPGVWESEVKNFFK